ncbi:MAG TPA: hypothetical protein VHX61_13585 [Rhizomicrobium sp.]|jgi:hypothetical protein|nr:hypothetical protein [Rhizomicrobium sp.]
MKHFRLFNASNMCATRAVGASLPGLLCLALAGSAQAAAIAPSADAQLHMQWRAAISATPVPGSGCFTAHYPGKAWTRVACTAAPNRLYLPASGSGGFTVGNGHDYAAEVSGIIGSGVGSFPKIKGLTSETNDGSSNTYSLQMNSQFFASPACSGGEPDCFGWQQFIYAQPGCNPDNPCVFMQSWLINYGSHCPSGWTYAGGDDCYTNSSATDVPTQALSDLADLQLSGSAVSGGNETVKLTTSNDAYSASESDTVVGLSGYWDATEFNIVGDGGGSEADFNEGTKIKVKIQLQDGSTTAPICESNAGTTGETNNLNLGTCKTKSGKKPSISFMESN